MAGSTPQTPAQVAARKRREKLRRKNRTRQQPNRNRGRNTQGSRGRRTDPMQQPFDLSNPQYTTRQSFEDEVNRVAGAQIQPGLDDVNQRERAMQVASDRRQAELRNWYGDMYTRNAAAVEQANQALNSMISAGAGANQQAQDTLAGALRSGQDSQASLVQGLGGQPTGQGTQAGLLEGSGFNAAALNNLLTSQGTAQAAGMAGDLGALSLSGIEAGRQEQARRAGLESEFGNERTDLQNQLGGLRSQARQTLTDSELARQNQMFQQYLAEKELGLSAKNQSFQQWLARQELGISRRNQREQERSGRAQRSLARQQMALDMAKIQADADAMEAENNTAEGKARADRYRNAGEMLDTYLQPTKAEVNKNGQVRRAYYERLSFDDALRMLRQRGGLGPIDSLMMLKDSLPSNFRNRARWVQRAERLIEGHRRSRRPGGGRSAVPRDPRTGRVG